MQQTLFPEPSGDPERNLLVEPATVDPALAGLATALSSKVRLGTASWNYPGWTGLVWARDYPEASLSRHGLAAYARHPLFRTVSLDRGFYRPLTAAQFAEYAAQVPADFRFMVKAPSLVTDAVVRDGSGRGNLPNDRFLDAACALREFVEPALQGLGSKLGVLVFQISPLPFSRLASIPELIDRLHALLRALPDFHSAAPEAVVAVEVRNPEWLTPAFTEALRDTDAAYCRPCTPRCPASMSRFASCVPFGPALWFAAGISTPCTARSATRKRNGPMPPMTE